VQRYGVSEVEKLLQLPRSTIRSLIKAGFVTPARGARGTWLFSFQDLVVLRRARALIAAKVPSWRVARAMKELRRQAESGQYELGFESVPKTASLVPARNAPQADRGYELYKAGRLKEAEAAYREALEAQGGDPVLLYNLGVLLQDLDRGKEALGAYQAALRGDPALADGHYNIALLYEALGRPKEAIRHLAQYRRLTRRPK
jgi:tetratricopeptide (TPR) repeat protein